MPVRPYRLALAATAILFACAPLRAADTPAAAAPTPQALARFTSDIRPLLTQHCLKCHGGEKTKGDFDLTTREGLLHPGHEGPNVIPGNAAKSRLMALVRHDDDPAMPAKADKLPDHAIATLAAWIDAGAPYDKPLIEKPRDKRNRAQVTDADRRFWSFQPLANPTPPATNNTTWPRTPIDRFILARLEQTNLTPNPAADRRKLIRRAYLDLLGLPPKPEDVESFVNDPHPDAYEQLVDRLLASPHYGERWARHWLDLARFAESHGYEHDYDRPTAYHYRDFVIRALNQDMPFTRFVRLQLAGDELEPHNPEAIKATGYLAAGTHATQITVATAEKERYDEMDDMAATVGTSLLGLTIGCARCHDHKYDPIPARDYYRFLATFTTTVRSEAEIDPAGKISWPTPIKDPVKKSQPTTSTANTRVLACSEGVPPVRLHTALPEVPDFYNKTYFLKRGDTNQKDGEVTAGFLTVLTRAEESRWITTIDKPTRKPSATAAGPLPTPNPSHRRSALAHWITDTDRGAGHLLARVIVNRLWQHHFGRGLVSTPNDFGAQGAKPTHPELLDYLAQQLIAHKWHLKPLHKLIMTSAVYTQSSSSGLSTQDSALTLDPENHLLSRFPVTRLEGEAIRDAMLAISGQLDPTPFGPGTLDESTRRRSIYFFVKRSKLIPMMTLFDWPDTLGSLGQRSSTTVAPQALALLNHPQIQSYAHHFARSLLPLAHQSREQAVHRAYLTTLSRHPDPTELATALDYLHTQPDLEPALTTFCQTLFCLNEFIYVE